MKNVIISLLIFIVLFISILFSVRYLDSICKKLQIQNDKIENYVDGKDWKSANDSIKVFSKDWDKYSAIVSVFVHHQELDDINSELQKFTQFVRYEDQEGAQSSSYTIKFYLSHISEMEKWNLQNIF